MNTSMRAKLLSNMLRLYPKPTGAKREQMLADALKKGETPPQPPKQVETRYEDHESGRIFFANEKDVQQNIIFYIHGGAYILDLNVMHWQFIDKLIEKTDARIIAPAYRIAPFGTYKEAFDLIVPVYREYCEKYPDSKIIVMGDSAGGGLSLALAELCTKEGIRQPDELVLISPWVDAVMDNPKIKDYEKSDPSLSVEDLSVCAKSWADGLDLFDWRISPAYGDLSGIRNVTVFTGTCEIFYPDITKFYHSLEESQANELIVGNEMCHIYPLFPIPEAKQAIETIVGKITR